MEKQILDVDRPSLRDLKRVDPTNPNTRSLTSVRSPTPLQSIGDLQGFVCPITPLCDPVGLLLAVAVALRALLQPA